MIALIASMSFATMASVSSQELLEDCYDCTTAHTIDSTLAIEIPGNSKNIESVLILGRTSDSTISKDRMLIGETPLLPKVDLAAHRTHGWMTSATYRVSGTYSVASDQTGEHRFVFSAQDFYGTSSCSVTAYVSDHEITQIALPNISATKQPHSLNLAFEEGTYALTFDVTCAEDSTVSLDVRVVTPGSTDRRAPDLKQPTVNQANANYARWVPDDRAQVQSVQRGLNALGFGAGPADGLIGRLTRNAVTSFAEATEFELEMSDRATVIEKIEQARRNELYVSYDTETAFVGRPFSNLLRQRLARYSLEPIKETFDRLMAVSDAAPGTNLSWSINSQAYGHITLLDTYKDCVFTEQSITIRDQNEFGRYYVCRDLSAEWTLAKQKPSATSISGSGS